MSSTAWRVSADVVWAGEDSVRLYNVESGAFQTLNPTGSAIWCLMAGGKDTTAIAEELTQRLAGGSREAYQEIAMDVEDFLRALAGQQMVVASVGEKADEGRHTGEGTDEAVSQGAEAGHR
ncbi:hypothetical protein GCM10023322_59170 [Rugosimonospora acidiphila]|uniref:PqqD family protein n=1 Tax=Rugosimonospora acidiphila TaxID=556531 RepID=A0ABP9SEC4_9ACTN